MKEVFFVILIFLCSCVDVSYEESSGGINEILFVLDKEHNKKSIKDFINSKNQNFKGLPQKQKTLDITYITSQSFKDIFKKQRCIAILAESETESFRVINEKWAGGQKVFYFTAPDSEKIKNLLYENIDTVFHKTQATHIDFLFQEIKSQHNKDVYNYIKDKFNISFYAPGTFVLNKEEKNTVWFLSESEKTDYLNNILIYTHEDKKLSSDLILELRESKIKDFIETQEGSYMTTDKRYDIFFNKDTSLYFLENTFFGLWRLEGATMGGPFYSKIIRDTINDRLIFLESFLFYPNENKRNIMIQNKTILDNVVVFKN
tara:strand:+ start:1317 stop:2267 length:951 start_codon:yes stop_codon:yes gene_type:complete